MLANICSLQDDTFVSIMELLCFNQHYGGHVNEQAFASDVFNFIIAVPSLYNKMKLHPKFKTLANQAQSEYNFRQFYQHY